MQKFTNVNILKEKKKKVRNLILSIIIILIAYACKYWETKEIEKANQNMVDLNTIIISEGDKENKKAYLDAQTIPYKFAVYDDTTDSYYIVGDSDYLYIVYMSVEDFQKLNKEEIYDEAIRIEGVTKTTTKDVQELAIDTYNEGLEKEEQLTLADFENYFGAVFLDMTVEDSQVALLPFTLFLVFTIFGHLFLIVALIEFIQFNRGLRKLDDNMIYDLDKEMNDSKAFYYEKTKLYLTENYIINFANYFKAIRYEDVLWMYRFEQRTNGVKTNQSIKILVNDGKTYNIASVAVISKAKLEVYNEIWKTIASKNTNMLLGYTSENIKAMRIKVKEIKKNK